MSIRPHKKWPGWWIIDYYPEGRAGKKIIENFNGSEEEAQAYERQIRGIHISKCRTTINPPFKEIAAEFREWAKVNRSASYYATIKAALKHLLPHFGLMPPSRITDAMCEQYKLQRKTAPVACNYELGMLVTICNWGADQKRNYCQRLPFKPDKLKVFRTIPEPPAPGEFDRLLRQVRENFKHGGVGEEQQTHKIAMLVIMYSCGLRWIECRHLRWEHIRKEDGRAYLGRTKSGQARYTFIPPEVVNLLTPIWQEEGYCFTNPRTGLPYTTMYKSLHSAARKCGIRMKGAHTLRHALGTDLLEATGDIRGVQTALGHSDIKTSTLYEHTATGRLKRLLDDVRAHRGNVIDYPAEKYEPDYCI